MFPLAYVPQCNSKTARSSEKSCSGLFIASPFWQIGIQTDNSAFYHRRRSGYRLLKQFVRRQTSRIFCDSNFRIVINVARFRLEPGFNGSRTSYFRTSIKPIELSQFFFPACTEWCRGIQKATVTLSVGRKTSTTWNQTVFEHAAWSSRPLQLSKGTRPTN